MKKAYFRVYGVDKEDALREVDDFITDSDIQATVENTYEENEVEEVNTNIRTYLENGLNYEEVFNVVSLIKDLKGLKLWCDICLVLQENRVEVEEFDVLEHSMDLDILKVISLNYEENCKIYIVEVNFK